MKINPEKAHAFVRAYKEEFGETITDDEAVVMMIRCLQLMEVLASPYPGEDVTS